MTEQQNQSGLPALYNITKQQAWIAGIPAGASVIADIATHANPGVMFVGGLIALAIGVSSKEVAEMVIPGSNPDQVRASLDVVVQAVTPEIEEEYVDQRAISKIRRLMHDKNPDLYETQDIMQPDAVAAQPKDDTRRVVDESEQEDEYLAPLPGLTPIFPVYPENETMHLGKVVATGQRFDPSINNFLGYGAIFAGSQGSGKSVAVAVVAEHLGERGVSEVLFDMKREYFSILKVVANGIVAGHPDAAKSQDFQGLPFYGLTVENAAEFAADVMEKGYQAVVDIPSFLEHSGNDWNLVARVITAVQDGLMRWSIAQDDQDRLPCLIGYDEAHIFFPQNAEMKNLFDLPVLNKLNASTFSMVNMGRSYGYTMLFSTQRIANIAKWTIGNCQIKVIMRHSVDVDLERCSKEIGKDERGKLYATEQDIKTLPAKQGYGYVLGFTQEPYLIQFDMRRSYHPSNTPTMERVQQRKVKSTQPVQPLPELFEEEESGLSMRALCEAVLQMAEMHYKVREIIQLLEISEGEYLDAREYILSHKSEFRVMQPTSNSTSQASGVPTSSSTSRQEKKLHLVNGHEGSTEVGRSGLEVENASEVDAPGNFELTEREIRMGEMFFVERVGINVIMKEFFPGVTGGDRYQKASAEINDALRKYVEVKRGA